MPKNNKRTAVIDIGTLKIKFEICEFDNHLNAKTLFKEKYLTVLGRDLDKTNNMIIEKAINNTIEALLECKCKLSEYGVNLCDVVATDALRKAQNGDIVIKRIVDETGFTPRILTHSEEGEIYFRALAKEFGSEDFCAVDIGGGSVQVIIGNDNRIFFNKSFKTGAYLLQETFSKTHHPNKKELSNAKKYISEQLLDLKSLETNITKVIYGSTNIKDFFEAMNLELIHDTRFKDHPYSIDVKQLIPLYESIVSKSYEDRMCMFPAEPYYMWAADKALMNIFQISEYLNADTIVPTNYNISTGLHYLLSLKK